MDMDHKPLSRHSLDLVLVGKLLKTNKTVNFPYVKYLKISNTFHILFKKNVGNQDIWLTGSVVIRTVIHKMLVRIANMEDPVRLLFYKQSDLGLQCLSRIFWQTTSVRNFRTFTYFKDNETNF